MYLKMASIVRPKLIIRHFRSRTKYVAKRLPSWALTHNGSGCKPDKQLISLIVPERIAKRCPRPQPHARSPCNALLHWPDFVLN